MMSTVIKATKSPEVEALTNEDMDNLRHMLGADDRYGRSSWGFRNYFAAEPNTEDDHSMQRLLAAGYVKTSGTRHSLIYYHATPEGCEALGFTKAQKQRAMDW